MSTLELKPMACLPIKPLPDGVLGVLIDPAASTRLSNRDLLDRASVFSHLLDRHGLLVKVGPFAFYSKRSEEAVCVCDPDFYIIFSGIVTALPSSERDCQDITVLGRIMTCAPAGMTFDELCRGGFGRRPIQQRHHRESLGRLIDSGLVRNVGQKYVLTAAGVRKAILEGYTYTPGFKRR